MQLKEMPMVKEPDRDYEAIKRRLSLVFLQEIYLPLLRELRVTQWKFRNDKISALVRALQSGLVTYTDGRFYATKKGFGAKVSAELRALGAKWSMGSRSYRLDEGLLPMDVRQAISAGTAVFEARLARIDKLLAQKLPAEIAGRAWVADLFDIALWRVQGMLDKSVKGITVMPNLTDEERRKIANEWQKNMDLWVTDFTAKEIVRLRENMQKLTLSGNRYETAVAEIKKSFGVSQRKAEFLARQESRLLMAKFKETRYTGAGLHQYRWQCVKGSPRHPVRPSHKRLDGKIFRWDNPPVTTPPNEPVRRCNPGQDYNCRCNAVPVIQIKR